MLDLADTFLAADLRQRVGLLNEHGDQLRDDFVGRYLRGRNDSPAARGPRSVSSNSPASGCTPMSSPRQPTITW